MPKPVHKYLAIFACILFFQQTRANILAIDISKIKCSDKLRSDIEYVKQNLSLYSHWVPEWKYETSKEVVVKRLTSVYDDLSALPDKNEDTFLLLGDVAHFLYNLDLQAYYDKAVANYKAAAENMPSDYRTLWFLGNHYALAAQPVQSIETYHQAFKLAPQIPDKHLWGDYAVACVNAGMTANASYAAHQYSKAQGGLKSEIEDQMSGYHSHVLHTVPVDTAILSKESWSLYGKKEPGKLQIVNWLAGMKFKIDSNWRIQLADYKNKTTVSFMQPEDIVSANGPKIGYSILLMAKVADPGETPQTYLNKFAATLKNRKPFAFDFNRDMVNSVATEGTDPQVYPQIGGSHTYAIAFERDAPEFSGQRLEEPMQIVKGSGVSYYVAGKRYAHVKQRMVYLVMLDTCEFINDQSLTVFKNFLSNLVVE